MEQVTTFILAQPFPFSSVFFAWFMRTIKPKEPILPLNDEQRINFGYDVFHRATVNAVFGGI